MAEKNKKLQKTATKELQKMITEISRVKLAFNALTQSIDEATRTMRRIADCLEAEYSRKRN